MLSGEMAEWSKALPIKERIRAKTCIEGSTGGASSANAAQDAVASFGK
jgi:hypothetical protein